MQLKLGGRAENLPGRGLGVYCTSGSERRRFGFSARAPNFNCIVLGAQKELDGPPQHFYISNNLYNPSVTFLELQNKI